MLAKSRIVKISLSVMLLMSLTACVSQQDCQALQEQNDGLRAQISELQLKDQELQDRKTGLITPEAYAEAKAKRDGLKAKAQKVEDLRNRASVLESKLALAREQGQQERRQALKDAFARVASEAVLVQCGDVCDSGYRYDNSAVRIVGRVYSDSANKYFGLVDHTGVVMVLMSMADCGLQDGDGADVSGILKIKDGVHYIIPVAVIRVD